MVGALRSLAILVAAAVVSATFTLTAALTTRDGAAAAPCGTNVTMNIVAHEDDDLLFQNPMVLQRVRAGACLRTVFATAGDSGTDADSYWRDREDGARGRTRTCSTCPTPGRRRYVGSGDPIPVYTLTGRRTSHSPSCACPTAASTEAEPRRNSYEFAAEALWRHDGRELHGRQLVDLHPRSAHRHAGRTHELLPARPRSTPSTTPTPTATATTATT